MISTQVPQLLKLALASLSELAATVIASEHLQVSKSKHPIKFDSDHNMNSSSVAFLTAKFMHHFGHKDILIVAGFMISYNPLNRV